jgi:hypothetical protein
MKNVHNNIFNIALRNNSINIINHLNKIWYNKYICNNDINNKCVICKNNDDTNDKNVLYIKCNLTHYVHIECQKKLKNPKCCMCQFIY